MLSPSLLIPVAVIVTLCSAVQSLAGFGFALFAVPLFVLCGLSLPQAVAICLAATLLQGVVLAVRHWREIPWRTIWPVIVAFIVATPLGLAAMGWLVTLGADRVKQGVGAGVLVVLALWLLARVEPRERVGAGWGLAAGAGGGILTGSLGMGGPPLVLWVLAHRWSSVQMRAALLTIYAVGAPVQFVMLWAQHRDAAMQAGTAGLLMTPLVVAGAAAGLWLGARLPTEILRRIMLGLLAGLALYAIVSPMVR